MYECNSCVIWVILNNEKGLNDIEMYKNSNCGYRET